jgi:hypothetical protein
MKILHLEDDGPLREILEVALKATAPTCEIHQFVNSDDALRYATENVQTVDLYILDVRVPGSMNGLQMAEKLRALDCPGVIVITSAYRAPDEAVLRRWLRMVPKPGIFSRRQLTLTMAQRKALAPRTPVVQTAPPAVPVSADAAPVVSPESPAPAMPTAPPAVPVSADAAPMVPPESPAPAMLPAPPVTPLIAAALPDSPVLAAPPAPVSADAAPMVLPESPALAVPSDPPTAPIRPPSPAEARTDSSMLTGQDRVCLTFCRSYPPSSYRACDPL